MKKIQDVNYCFLDDVGNGVYNPETFKVIDGKKEFNNKLYKDPDKYSKKLYETLKCLYSKKLPNGEELLFSETPKIYGSYQLVIDGIEITNIKRFSSDYIGPSIPSAKKRNINDLIIGNYLKVARTIGGHVFWPVPDVKTKGQTINTARGGYNGFNDRIDLTLIDLQKYYNGFPDCKLINQYIDSEDWFSKFIDFKGFIDFFYLQDFVDENYQVVLIAPVDQPIPFDFESFINNNIAAISKRNSRIHHEMKNRIERKILL